MKKNVAMGIGGVAAIVIDYLVVASVVGLLLLARWIGIGWALDVLTVLLISYVIIAWFYGKRFSRFLSRPDNQDSDSARITASGPIIPVKSARSGSSNARGSRSG